MWLGQKSRRDRDWESHNRRQTERNTKFIWIFLRSVDIRKRAEGVRMGSVFRRKTFEGDQKSLLGSPSFQPPGTKEGIRIRRRSPEIPVKNHRVLAPALLKDIPAV